ncbi:MAG: methyltransferase domain-containing protein [Proteobacteria bacterium]|nr:methyltransferase domain-containing protein [Burkholderiales bacterium]
MSHPPEHFDALFAATDDPWLFKSRWYEARKRALTLACLPAHRYAAAYEPGCANGELSAALAERCDHLLVSDGSSRAVALARARLADLRHVEVQQAWLPEGWPGRTFDLIVISELGYFLSPSALDVFATHARASLRRGGTILGCHWRRASADCELDGDAVHRRMGDRFALPRIIEVVDADLRIEVWCDDARSVAQREFIGP